MTLFPEPLAPEALRWRFDKSESLDLDGGKLSKEIFIGQERAERAMAFGLGMSSNEFNLYVSGPPGTGKYTMCRSYCERLACETDVPDSIAFVHNFSDSDRPLWLTFPAGIAVEFQGDMAMLVTELQESIPKAFEADAHESARKEIVESVQTQQRQRLEALEEKGRAVNFAIQMSQAGLNVIPLIDGKNATAEQFENLPEEERKRYEENRNSLATPISEFVKETRNLEKEVRARMRKLDENIALTAVKGPMDDLRDKYASFEKTISFLDMVERHILGNFSTFQNTEELGGAEAAPMMMMRPPKDENPFRVYEVNVVVDNSALECAPVVYESNPNFNNLFGRIERRAHFGTYTTDFTLVRAGSIVQASGGFLILNALDVLTNPGVWPALKRAIRTRCVRIEDLGETFGWSQGTIKPEPIPVNVKVLLMGSPMIYYLLLRQDEDFGKLFKVKADFSSVIKRTPASLRDFRAFVEFHRAEDGLLPFSDDAMARVLEASSRMVSDQSRLSAQFGELRELLLEADHWARQEEAQRVEAKHIICAEDEKRFRADLLDERLRDQIIEGHVMIDVEGEVIGQINGLAVLSMGDFSFGKPSRITAQTFMGDRGVINIERESKLSGNIHDKGMLILQGYLGATYARNHPLALSASITFEQNYGGVDGDSASSTELYALLSSLSGLPIKQGFAVTGSVNQRGEIQPIGGVNEKIEGFFEVCKGMGELTGEQGVLIPHQNVTNLMLRDEVVEAVRAGKFNVYPIHTVDEGISLLTGTPAGERDEDSGEFPEGSVHGMVAARLAKMYEDLRRLGKKKDDEEEEDEKPSPTPEMPPAPPDPPPGPPRRRGGRS
ncbi:MAG: AAA family ATPase [Nitrospinaceae bacterium]|jgi:predicted ATP-dependent protease|nr:AAA family ATPase [Nitrospinaceae bacterium]MBT4094541.1 AAA family ATPase [Nitrospinaceae bacterium]MBT5366740.1 AAA family ATPase [Nitrospinaceae bacterium]MBT5946441.1 AAA family ATPase [Nitrospinaceae bacterium]MBT6394818.1 AAA family ATPase [Nitrospinaceae bacterium]